MKIKEQTRKLAAGCSRHCFISSKHCFEVVDKTDKVNNYPTAEVSSKLGFEVVDRNTYLRQGDVDDDKAKADVFEEFFEEYKTPGFSYS
ncbi:hypothetical protein [Streptococcus pneumoniae]|uniref:hypothetical protein n=1 Tax=Streptococcus pneumoniae TaxID=1313 RepID=UPI000B58FF82|nr:hypothetical protein [Streptococcus pneumoniae]SNJ27008.1 N-ethylammeline chlorohydrolase [Streptococcus pneumoniae]